MSVVDGTENLLDTLEDNQSSEKDSSDFETAEKKKCIWCLRYATLLPDQRHCEACDRKGHKYCRRCHQSFDSASYFTLDISKTRCDSCQRKYLREKQQREVKKRQREVKFTEDVDETVPPKKKAQPQKTHIKPFTIGGTRRPTLKKQSGLDIGQQVYTVNKGLPVNPPTNTSKGSFKMRWLTLPIYLTDEVEETSYVAAAHDQ